MDRGGASRHTDRALRHKRRHCESKTPVSFPCLQTEDPKETCRPQNLARQIFAADPPHLFPLATIRRLVIRHIITIEEIRAGDLSPA